MSEEKKPLKKLPKKSLKKLPFHSFAFTMIENKRPRAALRMTAIEGAAVDDVADNDGLYELRVQKGSAANPTSQFTRQVPFETADRLRDILQLIGAFSWEAEYGDTSAPGSRRWTMSIVFEKDVFSVESKGGSDVPEGFDELLEELYRLDFPRPAGTHAAADAGGVVGAGMPPLPTSVGDLAAFASSGGLGGFAGGLFSDGLPNFDSTELQQRMKEEFRHMSADEQRQLIDMLVQTGMGTRDFWERFFRG